MLPVGPHCLNYRLVAVVGIGEMNLAAKQRDLGAVIVPVGLEFPRTEVPDERIKKQPLSVKQLLYYPIRIRRIEDVARIWVPVAY
ncbi:MAG: hypothetical protein JWR04_356 [Rhodoglobus sp.]|nr:hypothetical protein [Rhodoglobus sp.]